MSTGSLKRILLAVAIFDMGLLFEKYFMYSTEDAAYGAIAGLNISTTTVCLLALYGIWISELAVAPFSVNRLRSVGLPAVAYLAMAGLSIFAAQNKFLAICEVFLLSQTFLLLVYVANHIRSKIDIEWILGALAMTLAAQAMFVFLGHLMGNSIELGPIKISYDAPVIYVGTQEIVHDEIPRSGGALGSPVLAGSFMALLMFPVMSTALLPVSRTLKKGAGLAVLLAAPAVMLTGTRGAVITLAIGCSILGFGLLRRGWLPKWVLMASTIPAALALIPFINLAMNRTLSHDGESASSRIHHAQIAGEMIGDSPLFGAGAGNCHLAMRQYADQSQFRSKWFYSIHNKFLLLWVETGAVGLAAFLLFLTAILSAAWTNWRTADSMIAILSLAIFAGIVGHMVHMSVDVFNSRPQVQILWCCAGLVLGLRQMRLESQNSSPSMDRRSMSLPYGPNRMGGLHATS